MTPAQRHILVQAKRLLEQGSYRFICHAINHASGDINDKKYLREYIMRKLNGCQTLDTWLYAQRCTHHRLLDLPMNYGDLQRYRIMWIDWMLTK